MKAIKFLTRPRGTPSWDLTVLSQFGLALAVSARPAALVTRSLSSTRLPNVGSSPKLLVPVYQPTNASQCQPVPMQLAPIFATDSISAATLSIIPRLLCGLMLILSALTYSTHPARHFSAHSSLLSI